jgi:tRNA threonylcarbamoyladenosine biosynthesis protein TsaE
MILDINSEKEQEALGIRLSTRLANNCIIYLQGELGTGKTTLVRGILRGLNYLGAVKSPTYTLIEPYYLNNITVLHLDLYRIQEPSELDYLGLEDFASTNALWLIEWSERGGDRLPVADAIISLYYQNLGRRLVFKVRNKICFPDYL